MAMKRRHEMGIGGRCLCPKCGEAIAHQRGIPCQEQRCRYCGVKMLREDSYHHRLFKEKQAKNSRKIKAYPK